MGWFTNYGKSSIGAAKNNLVTLLVKFDPETAIGADIKTLEDVLDEALKQRQEAFGQVAKEQKEFDAIKSVYNEDVMVAQKFQEKIDVCQDETEKNRLTEKLNTILSKIETTKPEVLREKQEAEDALAYFKDLDQYTTEAATKLKTAKQNAEKALNALKHAELQRKQSEQRAENAANLAGLRNDTTNVGSTALSALNKLAEKEQNAAEAAKKKTELLTPVIEKEDADIAAIRNELKGNVVAPDTKSRVSSLETF